MSPISGFQIAILPKLTPFTMDPESGVPQQPFYCHAVEFRYRVDGKCPMINLILDKVMKEYADRNVMAMAAVVSAAMYKEIVEELPEFTGHNLPFLGSLDKGTFRPGVPFFPGRLVAPMTGRVLKLHIADVSEPLLLYPELSLRDQFVNEMGNAVSQNKQSEVKIATSQRRRVPIRNLPGSVPGKGEGR